MDQDDAVGHEETAMEQVATRLHRRFDAALGPEEVDRVLEAARQRFTRSRIRSFVPVLVERVATDDLHAKDHSRPNAGPGPAVP